MTRFLYDRLRAEVAELRRRLSVVSLTGGGGGGGTPSAHASSHEDGGADEIDLTGLTGLSATPQTPAAHATSHQNGGGDEITVAGLSGLLADDQNPTAHASDHQNGGADEISVAGLSGLLADDQNPTAHASDHQNGGGDEISVTGLSGQLADAQLVGVRKNSTGSTFTRQRLNFIEGANVTLTVADDGGNGEVDITIEATAGGGSPGDIDAHATTHEDGGSDPVDVTQLDGYPGGTTTYLRADGTFASPPAGPGGSGTYVRLESNTVTAATTSPNFEAFAGGGYDSIEFLLRLTVAVDAAQVGVRFKLNGAYKSSGSYHYQQASTSSSGATDSPGGTTGTSILLNGAGNFGIGAGGSLDSYDAKVTILFPDDTTLPKRLIAEGQWTGQTGASVQARAGGMWVGTDFASALTGIQFTCTQNMTGTFVCYGRKA